MSDVNKYNILLLGKSGVGKSTLINSFANYMYFDTFKEAFQAEPICVIPTNYSVKAESGHVYNIQLGTPDQNESQVKGQPCTQKPKVYTSELLENTEYNFIDVPGIGNTCKTAADAHSRSQILADLKSFTEIHGILILLDSNDAMLEYQYSLTEILTMLHRDALKNIFFVCTHNSGQDKQVIQSLHQLRKYLRNTNIEVNITNENCFFIDNQGFRFQGFCNQHPNAVEKNEILLNNKIWLRSRKQMYRLLDCIRNVGPHEVKNSIALNEARKISLVLLEPISTLKTFISLKALEVDDSDEEYDIYHIKLNSTRTVCTSPTCAKTMSNDVVHYKQVCHNSCNCFDIRTKTYPVHHLRYCAAMDKNGMCKPCVAQGHCCSYKNHTQIDYETCVTACESNPSRTKKHPKTVVLEKRKDLKKEKTIMEECAIKSMAFLKDHAIVEHNKFWEEQINVEIRNEICESDTRNGKISDTITKFKNDLVKYKQNMEAWNAMAKVINSGGNVSADSILKMLDILFGLKHNGSIIWDAYNATYEKVQENVMLKSSTKLMFSRKNKVDCNNNEKYRNLDFTRYYYNPPDVKWMTSTCQKFGLEFIRPTEIYPLLAETDVTHTYPTSRQPIIPDGNCGYRALSFVITGSQDQHMKIRRLVCDSILSNPSESLLTFYPDVIKNVKIHRLGDLDFVNQHNWADTGHLCMAAGLLNVNIFIYTGRSERGPDWHCPREPRPGLPTILLENTFNAHWDVVTSIGAA